MRATSSNSDITLPLLLITPRCQLCALITAFAAVSRLPLPRVLIGSTFFNHSDAGSLRMKSIIGANLHFTSNTSVSVCQRWNPVDGFSERLLPSDRWQWSDVTGLQHQPLDGFRLPSGSWEWEGDWYVDENFDGEPTEKGVSVR